MHFLALALFLAAEVLPTSPDVSYSQPQIAADGQTPAAVFGSKNSIFFVRADSSPVRVADAPTLSLGNHRGPRLAVTSDAVVVTAGIGPPNQQYAPTTLKSWRSLDHGKTWVPGPDLSTPGAGGMGFQAIGSDGGKRLWAAWIGPANGHPTLFMSHSEDSGATWARQRVLSETVCECCHPSVAIAADGTVRILFRNSLDGNRDFYLATSKDGEKFQIEKLGQGSWKLDACPMDGGGMGEFQGEVATLWRRQGQIFLARTDGKPEEQLATGHNPAITLRKNGIYAIWTANGGIMVQTPGKQPRLLAKSGAFPVLAPSGPVFAAWEDEGKIRIERLDQ